MSPSDAVSRARQFAGLLYCRERFRRLPQVRAMEACALAMLAVVARCAMLAAAVFAAHLRAAKVRDAGDEASYCD